MAAKIVTLAQESEEYWDAELEKSATESDSRPADNFSSESHINSKIALLEARLAILESKVDGIGNKVDKMAVAFSKVSDNECAAREFQRLQHAFAAHRTRRGVLDMDFLAQVESHLDEVNALMASQINGTRREQGPANRRQVTFLPSAQEQAEVLNEILQESLKVYRQSHSLKEKSSLCAVGTPHTAAFARHISMQNAAMEYYGCDGAADSHVAAPWQSAGDDESHLLKPAKRSKVKAKIGDIPDSPTTRATRIQIDPKTWKRGIKSDCSAFSDASGSTSTR